MDNAGYTTLGRQAGLLNEMRSVAQNIANMSTTGYRREGVVFSEFMQDLGPDHDALSMAAGRVREMDFSQGPLTKTEGSFDLAIEGDGFFLVATPQGDRLTRAGHFARNAAGELVTPQGHNLLDASGAPVFVPPDARGIGIAADGTVSADGQPVGQIGLWDAADRNQMIRVGDTQFDPGPGGADPLLEGGVVLQGYLESSNVNPVIEMTRMIEVQRAYELGQSLLDREDERIRNVVRTLGQ
ncbi:MAG: flagellar hook-basal body complex protein [Pseudomonadota bacterium]